MEISQDLKTLFFDFTSAELKKFVDALQSSIDEETIPFIKYRFHYTQPYSFLSITKNGLNDLKFSAFKDVSTFMLSKTSKGQPLDYLRVQPMYLSKDNIDEEKLKHIVDKLNLMIELKNNKLKKSSTLRFFNQFRATFTQGDDIDWLFLATPSSSKSKPGLKDNSLCLNEDGTVINRLDLKNILKLPNITAECLSYKARKRTDLRKDALAVLKGYYKKEFQKIDVYEYSYVYNLSEGAEILNEIEQNLNNNEYQSMLMHLDQQYQLGAYDPVFKRLCKIQQLKSQQIEERMNDFSKRFVLMKNLS